MFVDEAGFYPLPFAARTDAPCGQRPVLCAPLSSDHLSKISGVTPDGRLFARIQDAAFRGPAGVGFLRHLLRQIPGRLMGVWDGTPIHRGQAVKDFLGTGATKRLHRERLPASAPDRNLDEGVWNHRKRGELKHRCCQDLDELRWELSLALRRLRR